LVSKIVLFNHKGGVSKTTTTFNLGWMLASKGKKVILADFDPQCNLTGMVLDYRGSNELEALYHDEPNRNIREGLAPAFESRPSPMMPVDCIPVKGRDGLFLLPGHIRLSEYEETLGIAQTLSGSIQTLQNLPGSIPYLLDKTAEKFTADYVLIDTSPSLSSFNQNLLMTSDFFLVPTSPDFFSVMAIDSLTKVFPNWYDWAKKARELEILKNASYPFPDPHPKFLGIIVQKYRPRGGATPARAFQNWIEQVQEMVKTRLAVVLKENGMMLPDEIYTKGGIGDSYMLASIPDFNSLVAKSQETQTPIFELTDRQIGQVGVVLEQTKQSMVQFKTIFSDFADRVIALIDHAKCN